MLEDYAAILVQKFLGNYVRGINKEALKISAWQGDVELKNMQLRPEALNALKLPVKVKAGFLGSVRLKVPWSKLGQEPVVVYLDRIFILAEPALQVEGSSEEALQEAKRNRVKEMEMKLLEARDELKPEANTSWLSSVINTIVGNLKLSISNIHIRYEDTESNPGHPFAAGLTLGKLLAVTVDDHGTETFATGVNLDRIRKSVVLESLAFYFDSDSNPWEVDKPWEDLRPSEWSQIFEFGEKDDSTSEKASFKHSYILQPVTGTAIYTKLRLLEARRTNQALQKAAVDLDDVTLSLSKDGYRDIIMMADNFSSFNQRLKYAHYRPSLPVKSDPKSWWKYAYRVVTEETKKASGRLAWDQVLRYSKLRKKYVSLYASLLKADLSRMVIDDDEEIKKLDRQLDTEVILQWRMLAHKFVEESTKIEINSRKQKAKQSWWPFGTGSTKEEPELKGLTDEDWEKLNKIIGYSKENSDEFLLSIQDKNLIQFSLKVRMKHNASRLTQGDECLADLSCDELLCNLQMYTETKIFDVNLDSYKLSSPYGLLAKSATASDSFGGVFYYKPFEEPIDWSFTAKAKPCYVTYLKESIDLIVAFFKSSPTISQNLAMEAAAAVQMTIDEVKRTAQQQVTRALKEKARFSLDLDIAAPKITIPSKFCPDGVHETKLLLDLGNLILRTQEMWDYDSADEEEDMYLQFNLDLSDVSAFLVDGDYEWSLSPVETGPNPLGSNILLPVIDKCGIVVKLQQIQLENPCYPSTRLAVRLPSLGFHFSPARYHRLMAVSKVFQGDNTGTDQSIMQLQDQANLEGWLSVLSWKGVGNREPVWQQRYLRLVGPFLYIFENNTSPVYKRWISLRGKQIRRVNSDLAGGVDNTLAMYDSGQFNPKEYGNALILLCESDEARRTWHKQLQGAIYRASGAPSVATISEGLSPDGFTRDSSFKSDNVANGAVIEKLFLTGVLDELRVCFSCSYEGEQDFKKILLSNEKSLFMFRAVGGQVELSMKAGNILLGTILRSLEIEDQYSLLGGSSSMPRYLARSFISSESDGISVQGTSPASLERARSRNSLRKNESDDNFFEATDDFDEVYETPHPDQHQTSSVEFSLKPPGFSRLPGLIPDLDSEPGSEKAGKNKDDQHSSDSFIKAQIVVFDQSSPQYKNLDNRVIVTLATLSFFCYRPTIIAIMEFANAINYVEGKDNGTFNDNGSDNFSGLMMKESEAEENSSSTTVRDPPIRGLLGKGKSMVIFHLTLNMAKAAIYLMNEAGSSIATLSQNNLLTDIKVFPSSFSIKAALGNLKISDDSLNKSHQYYWVCDMRNPEGTSFVEIDFTSFSVDDEDYCGYDYSLTGELSEVRIVYLNHFVQEIIGYFMGLVPRNADSIVKLKDNVTDSEKWVSKSDIEGDPAFKLKLSLSRPIILMPRSTNSLDFLELDVVTITVENTFQWLGGDKSDIHAIHLDLMTIKVKDINLSIGIDMLRGESIIQDVRGLSLEIKRSLRDLSHLMPAVEASIKMEFLKASLSNREYEIITECASSNFSETPNIVPSLYDESPNPISTGAVASSSLVLPENFVEGRPCEEEVVPWITMKCSVTINLIELSLHSGFSRDSPLASLQATGAWLLYKSNTLEQGFLFATLKGFSVLDDREGTREEFRLAIGKSMNVGASSGYEAGSYREVIPAPVSREKFFEKQLGFKPIPSMLILDATFKKDSTNVYLCIQRPKFLVALDFLVAVIEFFVPSFGAVLSNEDDKDQPQIVPAIMFVDQIYTQEGSVLSISAQKPLIADDERFNHFIYDGNGGKLLLQDRNGDLLLVPSPEPFIFVGSGKRLKFRNVTIVGGEYLDSCISLGSDSSYLASEADGVYLDKAERDADFGANEGRRRVNAQQSNAPTETIVQLQAIGPELTFFSSSKNISEQSALSTKVIHANTDAFCRIVMKGDSLELSGDILGLKMESNGIRVLEPFDTSVKYSSTSGRTNINLGFSEIYMNFSFSILRLFLAVQDDILSFMRTSSKKATELCTQFDNVATIHGHGNDRVYAFWRPRAPSGFAVLGDCLTPQNEPPAKGVVALNTSLVRVKRPVAYKLMWQYRPLVGETDGCSIWFPVAPRGYVAVGCVASAGSSEPPLSAALCILASYVSSSALRDCIVLKTNGSASSIAFWRVDNCFGSFILEDPENQHLVGKPYDLRHMLFQNSSDPSSKISSGTQYQTSQRRSSSRIEGDASFSSGRLLEVVESPKLIWWNNDASSRKRLSIWRPRIPPGMVFFGDIAVKGYEQPNSAIVLRDLGDETLLRPPISFQLVGRIKKQRGINGISFWYPQPPPGFTSLGCIASKTVPKPEDFPSLRCIRSDMLTSGNFPEESIWDSSDVKALDPFSLWSVEGDSLGTFIVRNGFRKPQRRLAHKLLGPPESSGSDSMVIEAALKSFSAVAFDDYGGLMMPLFGVSLDNIGFSMRGRPDYLNATANFSLVARSFNDKSDSWEPLVEPTDGFLRYQYDMNSPGTPTQLRMTSTRELSLNVSVSNVNMIFQAYSSWYNLSRIDEACKQTDVSSPNGDRRVLDVHQRKNYYIVPQNYLGQDIYIKGAELKGFPSIIKLPSGDGHPIRVPIPKNSMHSRSKGQHHEVARSMITVIIAEAEIEVSKGLSINEYMAAAQLYSSRSSETPVEKQIARTCAVLAEHSAEGFARVYWKEMFFFKVFGTDDYSLEITIMDVGRGEPVGSFSSALKDLVFDLSTVDSPDTNFEITLRDLVSTKMPDDCNVLTGGMHGKIKFAVIRSGRLKTQQLDKPLQSISTMTGLQISPSKDGPWTTVKLNYATPATCWRFGNDVIASEMTVRDSDRYVTVRSLVSVTNSTNFVIEVQLKGKRIECSGLEVDDVRVESEEFVESQKYVPAIGWTDDQHQDRQSVELPNGWEWTDNWHLELKSSSRDDGWIYKEDQENRRQRKWLRHRKFNPHRDHYVSIGELKPGATIPLPLPSLTNPSLSYSLEIRPISTEDTMNYAWSILKEGSENEPDEICVSNLVEADKLLFCSMLDGSPSSSDGLSSVWFCVSIDAKEIGKDIYSDPIHDWNIVVKPPLSLAYYLPFSSQYNLVVGNELGRENGTCFNGTIAPGATVKFHNAGPNDPLYLVLLPQGGWEPMHEPVIISHPTRAPSKLINLRNAFSQRVVQITLEHNYDKDCPVSKVIRIYVPYWISCARLPPLGLCIMDISGKERTRFLRMSQSANKSEKIISKVTPDEMVDGYTIASVLGFKGLALSASIVSQGKEVFGPVKDLTPLGDMDGSIDLIARDVDGNCMKILVSSKPSSFQAVPTKAIMLRPFMTFINMVGQDMYLKLNDGEEPQTLFASDWKVSFPYCENDGGPDKFQVRLSNTDWSYPVQISKEDSIVLVMRKADGGREFLRSEVRAYEEGSRFLVVFRLGPAEGPIRIENRTRDKTIQVQQADLRGEAPIHLEPHSTAKYSLDNPYGRKVLDVGIFSGTDISIHSINLENWTESSVDLREKYGIQLHIKDVGDIRVVIFLDEKNDMQMERHDPAIIMQKEFRSTSMQFEVIVELGVVGVSLIDHRPKELLYLHLQRVFISYLTGTVSRFKLLIGHLQLDNELPLTVMPVLLAPEEATDLNHSVFKSNIAISNETVDGTEVYPFVYLRVTKSLWRLNVHEPIIWALVDFYSHLHFDSMPTSSSVTQVDPEMRIEVINISEVRLKISLETAPTQRPRGVLGIWSPIFSAVGSALKIQVHLRKVEQENKYMKKSQVLTAIINRIKRDLVHNPLHLIFSLDVVSMTKSALASLSKGFAELSTDGQFVQLRSQQVSSRKVTGVGDGLVQGTEAFAQGVAFGVSGVLTKPVESARRYGLLGFAHGLGRAFVGFIVQPLSGLLDFGSLTVDGIGASFIRCLEILNNKSAAQRIRNPRAIRADSVVREYSQWEASGQMMLYLAEASRHLACTDLFREPSKYAWSDYYEDHFIVPSQRIVLVTNKRVMLLQCQDLEKMDKRPSKILWDVPWEEVLALELAKRGHTKPSMLIIHLKSCRKSGNFSRYIRCKCEEEDDHEPQAVVICYTIRRLWKAYQANNRVVLLKVPSSRHYVKFISDEYDGRESNSSSRPMIKLKRSPSPDDRRFLKHTVNFQKIWSSEREIHSRCTLFRKQVADVSSICSIWRPLCQNGYVTVGDIVHVGTHAPSVAAVYRNSDNNFALPVGFDLVWRNCAEDYNSPLTIWLPRAPDGYVAIGCVAVAAFDEPAPDSVYCVSARLTEETSFVEQPMWAAPDSFPWSCYFYQVQSEALQFVALRLRKEEINWRALRVSDQVAGFMSG
ncbi:Pleckstrin (PH) domain-containing protein isoform 2 [Rhynchospora pubera]|uniref:Pleckstrin (PH) domain-containing protein isoform 2 n=1 Tax=Rhynchospora pubera TaxID=906938 RepID=A0AAV8EBD7_9POAL|nr:Pleckstrin (PH) domain-containing protein isoform 2 [Rhynchospora pubera]